MQNITDDFNSGVPEGINKMFCSASENFPWSPFRESFTSNAFSGVRYGLFMTLLMIVLLTRNLKMTMVAFFYISFILFRILAKIESQGFEYGLTECTSVILLFGLSADYVMQVCHQYM